MCYNEPNYRFAYARWETKSMSDAGFLIGFLVFILLIVIIVVIVVVTSLSASIGAIAAEEDSLMEEE